MSALEASSNHLRQIHKETRRRIAGEVDQMLSGRIESITDITSPAAAKVLHEIEKMESKRFLKELKSNADLACWVYGDDWKTTIEHIEYWNKDEAERLEEEHQKRLQEWQEKPLSIKEKFIYPLCWLATGVVYGILGGIIAVGLLA